jgi:hypothetical protein
LQQSGRACRHRWHGPAQGDAVDFHGQDLQPGSREQLLKWIDLALPARGDQHIGLPWVLGGRPQHLKVQGQVIQRKGKSWSACSSNCASASKSHTPAGKRKTLQITCEAGNARATWR